jgi:hypothetical protein
MVLVKGFLRHSKNIIDYQRLISGFFLGTVFSYIFYKFFYYFREIFRILSNHYSGFLIELTPKDHFYYNLFYGSISAIMGLYIMIIYAFENSINVMDKKIRIRQRAILNDHRFFHWNFINAFFRMTWLFGFWLIILPIQYHIDFLRDFSFMLILIPVVLFLNIWPVVLKTLGRKGYKWMLYSFIYVSVLSLIYGNISFNNYLSLNHNLKKSNIVLAYSLQYPISESFQIIEQMNLVSDIYLVKDSAHQDQPVLYLKDIYNKAKHSDLILFIYRELDYLPENLRQSLIPNLHIDNRITLDHVNILKNELRKSGVRTIQYSTGAKNSIYPPYYLHFGGIQHTLEPRYYRSFATFLDSAENLDFTKRTLRLPESPMYRFHKLREHHHIKINITPEKAFLNGREISDEKLRNILYKFIKGYSPNYNIIFEPDEAIEYGRYIFYLDMIHSAIDKLRHQMSYQLFNKPFDNNRRASGYDTIIETFPRNIMEWSPEEKRLIELVKRSGFVR